VSGFARILLTGGGTGGHVNPALAIGRALADEQTRFLYVGVRGRAEAEIVPREGLPIAFVRAAPFPGLRPSPAWVPFLLNLAIGTFKALFVVRRFRPDVIVGTGGFASAPVMFAAAALRRVGLLRARIYVHEQNAAPGRLNLLIGRVADRVFVSFPETLATFPANGFLSGYPLRHRIQPVSREEACRALDIDVPAGRQVVLAFGGSQGARTINRAIVDALGELAAYKDRLFVIHGTGLPRTGGEYDPGRETDERLDQRYGRAERELIAQFYAHRPYFHHIEHVYGVTDIAVVRGGAGTLSEVAALGLPAIVIPKVNLPGEHQVMNARALARSGGAVVLYEETRLVGGRLVEELDGHVLARTLVRLLDDRDGLARMSRAATTFLHGDALETIRRRVVADVDGHTDEAGAAAAHAEVPALLGNAALLGRLERASAKAGAAYNVASDIVSADDRAYYVSRAASLLASPSWESRNLGVKLIGLLQARDKLPLVLALLADRRPVSWYKRVLGGDYEQVGFIRRNALTTLGRLRTMSPEVEGALIGALSDPYYEARAEAARTIARLEALLSDDARARLLARLVALLHDRWLEVAAVAAESLGRIGDASTALPALLALRDERQWIVRSAGLRGVLYLIERGKAGNLDTLDREIRGYVLTATDFRPEFLIKTSYAKVLAAIAARKESAR
jgi:UDP-N-acetylglucosamine--N-acetylmuramyl-(pentapeptide) pyrophosphoryl-undecaprenol N-acetylglucosamine transferase